VLIVAGQLFVSRLLRRLRHTTSLAVALVILGIGFGLTAFADAPAFYALTVLIWTVGEMFHAPSISATTADLSPAHLRGRYQGVFSLSWSGAAFLAPIAGGALLQYAGPTTLWLGCLVLGLLVAAIHLSARSSRERRAAEIAAAERAPVTPAPAAPAPTSPAPAPATA
jgi:MFS family permease